MAAKFITEVLDEINKDVSLFQTTYKKYGNGGPLGILFKHAFTAEHKFILPEGEPPYKPDSAPQGVGHINFIAEIKKFNLFCRKDITPMKREALFIQLLEAVHPNEAKIIIAVKDQKLTDLYPNITRAVVAEAGFIPPLTPEGLAQEVEQTKKPEKKRGRRSKLEILQDTLHQENQGQSEVE